MEISFRGRGARTGRNNNLLTSHVRNAMCYLASTHAFELPLSLRPFGCSRGSAPGLASRTAANRVNRNCHLSSRRFTIPFTPAAAAATISDRPRASWSFGAIHQRAILVYPRRRQRGTSYAVLPLQFSVFPSHFANLVPPLLNYPRRNYVIKTILLKNLNQNLSHTKNITM